MVLIGLVLLILGAGLGAASFVGAADETGRIAVSGFGFTREAHPLELIGIGGAAVLLFCLGWALLAAAARRRTRARREEREQERLDEIERRADEDRSESARQAQAAGVRDQDLRAREEALRSRTEALDERERDLGRREAEWRDREGPSVADVVTGRAEGRVSEGTAAWANSTTPDGGIRPLTRIEPRG